MLSRLRGLGPWPLVIWSLVLVVLLLAPADERPPQGGVLEWVDKPVHALLFAVHCGLLALYLATARRRRGAFGAAFLASGLYGLLLEALQIPVPGRDWEWWDLAANLTGAALGALLVARSRARLRATL